MRGKDDIDYVKISACIFLDEYEAVNREGASGVLFNKFMTLLHRRFKAEGFNMKLPHCWYRWGDEVVRYRMPYLEWDHEYAAYTKVSWRGSYPDYHIDDPTIKKISQYSKEFIKNYSGPEGAELAIDEVYEDAPFDFQNEYRKLRENLKIYSKRDNFIDNYKTLVETFFTSAMEKFPNKDFNSIAKEKKDFEEVFRLSLHTGATPSELFKQAEGFWFFFCYHLRLNKKCHENVPPATLEVWEERIPWENDLFRRKLQDDAYQLSQKTNSKCTARIKELVKDWEERELEFESIISDISDDDKEEFEKFMRGGAVS